MKKIWLLNLGISLFQLAVFLGVAPFFAEQGRYTAALGIVSTVTFIVFLVAVFGRIGAVFGFVAAGAFAGALALTLAMAAHDIVSAASAFVGLYVVAFMMAYLATFPAMNDDPDKPRWALLISALPLGVGAIVGGILLRVFRKNTAGTSNVSDNHPQYVGRKFQPSVPVGEETLPSE